MSSYPVIILHGALGSQDQFKNVKELLSKQYETHAFDFEGHGGRLSENDFSIDLFAENVISFMREKGIKKANFFGYSMGGYVALNVSRKHPEMVGKIFTLGTKFDWTPESSAREIKMLNPEKIEEKIPKFAAILKERHSSNNWKMVLNKTADMMSRLGKGEGLKQNQFSEINNEVIISVGEEDNMVTRKESKNIANALKNGSIHIFKNFQHPIEKVDQSVLVQQICGFFG